MHIRTLSLVMAACALLCAMSSYAEEGDGAVEKSTLDASARRDLQLWFNDYAALWVEAKLSDVPAIVASFVLPLHIVEDSGGRHIRSKTELTTHYTELLQDSAKYDYSGDVLLISDIQLLSANSARIEADWMGLDLDRNPKGCFGRSYSLILSDGEWKISGFSSRDCRPSSER